MCIPTLNSLDLKIYYRWYSVTRASFRPRFCRYLKVTCKKKNQNSISSRKCQRWNWKSTVNKICLCDEWCLSWIWSVNMLTPLLAAPKYFKIGNRLSCNLTAKKLYLPCTSYPCISTPDQPYEENIIDLLKDCDFETWNTTISVFSSRRVL